MEKRDGTGGQTQGLVNPDAKLIGIINALAPKSSDNRVDKLNLRTATCS